MLTSAVIPQVEALLEFLHPGFSRLVEGNTDAEIEALQALVAPEPLPEFYRWFLKRMGRNLGPFVYPRHDFSASTLVALHQEGVLEPDPDHEELLIGFDHTYTYVGPVHMVYNFTKRTAFDAQVDSGTVEGSIGSVLSETFVELFCYHKFHAHRIDCFPAYLRCILETDWAHYQPVPDGHSLLDELEPALLSMGFESMLSHGIRGGLYNRADIALVTSASQRRETAPLHVVTIGGESEAAIKLVLGEVLAQTGLTMSRPKWGKEDA